MESLQTGLKDWQAVCRALETGRQIVLLRKGGIHETEGVFEMENREFVMFPTWLHQRVDWIKDVDMSLAEQRQTDPEEIELRVLGRVAEISRIQSRRQMDAIDASHIYLPPLIDMRFNYRPANPLYLIVVRAYSLASPVTIRNTPEYAGCRSWVPLEKSILTERAQPVLDDDTFAARVTDLKNRLRI
ncbi:MAG: DUF1802 family protein [Burkholderiales bacterium]|nr:DUF1802 family protein [Phycisphaerae bacterium]